MNEKVRGYLIQRMEQLDALIKPLEQEYRGIVRILTEKEESMGEKVDKPPRLIGSKPDKKKVKVKTETLDEAMAKANAMGISYKEYQMRETRKMVFGHE